MKKVMIIGSSDSGTKNNPRTLSAHLSERGIQVEVCFWEQLVFDIKTGSVKILFQGKDIATELKPELVIGLGWYKGGERSFYRDIAYATALYLKHAGVAVWNGEMAGQRSSTKLSCMVQLALEGLHVPQTLFSIDSTLLTLPEFPFVAKAMAASRGDSNFLVRSHEQSAEIFGSQQNTLLVQPFMSNDHDLRVICFGGEPSLVLRRSRAGDSSSHLNNTSHGGAAQWMDLADVDEKLLTISREICIVMKREMGGIDFIPDPSSPYGYSCLEVNAIPQLTSGYDTNKKLDKLAEIILQTERKVH